MILLALSTPSIHACGVDDGPRYLAPVPRPVLSVGRFSQALLGHSCQAPKHHSHQISKTQLKAQIPTNTQDHDFLVEVPNFEQFLDRYESQHLSIIPDSRSVCTRAL